MTRSWLTRDSRGVDMIIVTGSILARVDTFDDVRRSCLDHVERSKAFARAQEFDFRRRLDLDVQQGRFVGRHIGKGRFHGGCLGVIDGLKILVDRIRRRLGVLIDDELYSGLRHFNRYGINDHGMTLLGQTLSGADLRFVKRLG
jgi:hypothetical protein